MSSSRALYAITIFLSAFLLFLVEPMAAKQLLPILGGSSAVWLTCLVFFQLTLLAGYLYAHWLNRSEFSRPRKHLHLALLMLAILVLASTYLFHPSLSNRTTHPVTTIFASLALSIGLPFLLLASTSPLLQVWLATADKGPVPYRLFALSNAGSLLALLAYPTLVEPHLTLKIQRALWSLGFLLFAILCAILARQRPKTGCPIHAVSSHEWAFAQSANRFPSEPIPPPLSTKLLWFLLPMVAAMQLAAVTSHLTVNIAAIPLLWILPLAVYLLTFILAFEFPALYRRGVVVRLLVLMLASLGYALSKTETSFPILISILFFLAECFIACLFCHAETYALRPHRRAETTLFYLLIAAGGATGTFFIGIASPLIFSANYDLAIAFFLTAVMALVVTWPEGWPQRLLWFTSSILLFGLLVLLHVGYGRQTLVRVRDFYGTLRVKQSVTSPQGTTMRTLVNGTIQHGTQLFSPDLMRVPTTYYARDSGVGLALHYCCTTPGSDVTRPRNIGVIGLGVGTIAAYGTPGDRIRFYEINPQVQPIAQNLFTYLRDSAAQITHTAGDARTSLTHEAPNQFDVLVIDAFSGDAIPLHLLTTEAIALYKTHITPNGILAFHASNQYLDLAPEIALLAASANMQSRIVDTPSNEALSEFRSTWVLVTNNTAFLTSPAVAPYVLPIDPIPTLRPWTDDYSSLLPLLFRGHD